MGQGVVHVLHVDHVVLCVPDAVFSGKQVREELKESQAGAWWPRQRRLL